MKKILVLFMLLPLPAFSQRGDMDTLAREFARDSLYYKAYRLAEDCYAKQDFCKAEELYLYYLRKAPDKNIPQYRQAEKRLLNSAFAKQAVKSPVDVAIRPLQGAINTELSEYTPAISTDGKTILYTRRMPEKRSFQEDIYISYSQGGGAWEKGSLLKNPYINTPFNEGSPSFSADGGVMLFSACNRPDSYGSCDIYISQRLDNDTWAEPKNLGPFINSEAWEAHPSLSPDGRCLYFSSDRNGGSGGRDIWRAQLKDGAWHELVSLAEVNSPYDEVSPYIHVDGKTLYFSSDKADESMGRLDFMLARMDENGRFSKPENLGYPINTINEEFSLKIARDGKTAYFASDRYGRGGLDIVSFELPEKARGEKMAYLSGQVQTEAGERIKNSRLRLYEIGGHENLASLNFSEGKYFALLSLDKKYGWSAFAEGYLPFSELLDLSSGETRDSVERNIILLPIGSGSTVELKNVYFDIDKWELKPESFAELDFLAEYLFANPKIKTEVHGHTDNTGSDRHNITLSENRAVSVALYLQEKGIAVERIVTRGYGSSMPRQSNETENGRAANRRTEIKFID